MKYLLLWLFCLPALAGTVINTSLTQPSGSDFSDRLVTGHAIMHWLDLDNADYIYEDTPPTTNVTSSGDTIRYLDDRGPDNIDFTMSATGVTWAEPVSGKGLMYHQGSTTVASTGTIITGSTVDGVTIFIVGGTDSPWGGSFIYRILDNSYVVVFDSYFAYLAGEDYGFNVTASNGTQQKLTGTFGELYLWTVVIDKAGGEATFYRNGALIETDSTVSAGTMNLSRWVEFRCGGRNGFCKEAVFYEDPMTGSTLTDTMDAFMDDFGITPE